jgi:hypothetical protein
MHRGIRAAIIGALLLAFAAAGIVFLSHALTSEAVQAPRMSLDMVIAGNTYTPTVDDDFDGIPDPGTNVMNVGTVNSCLTTAPPGNNLQHTHSVQLVIQNVEDLIGWQAQLNYDGGKMRPNTVNFAPFLDGLPAQSISFQNLPFEALTSNHRDLQPASKIPAPAAGPQTARIGATHMAQRTLAVGPDSPAKAVPDDASYSAPTGGVLATLALLVPAGNAGQVFRMGLEEKSSGPPGSKAIIFTSTGQEKIDLADTALVDGFHLEGAAGTDIDLDGFSNGIECSAGTDPGADCASNSSHDAWPPDINNNGSVGVIDDLTAVAGAAFQSVPPAPARYDIDPDPPNGTIGVIDDLATVAGVFGQSCTP